MEQIPVRRGSLRLSQGLLIVFALMLLALDVFGYRVITWFLAVSHGLSGLRDGILLAWKLYNRFGGGKSRKATRRKSLMARILQW